MMENVKPDVTPKTRGPKLLLVLLVGVVIGSLTGPIVLLTINSNKVEKKADVNTVAINTQNEEIKNAIAKELVYTASGEGVYYSPTLDVSFKLDSSVMSVSEGGKSISIYSKNFSESIYGQMSLLEEDPATYYTEYYKGFSKLVISPVSQKDGYSQITATYEQENYLKKGEKVTATVNLLYKKDSAKNKYVVIKITSLAPEVQSAELLAKYVAILTSVNLTPENISPTITASLSDLSANVKFDKKKWSVTTQSSNYLSLEFIQKDYKEPYIIVRLDGGKTYEEKNDALLKKMRDTEITNAKRFHKEVKVISETLTATIGGQPAQGISFSYPNTGGMDSTYVTRYYGFIPASDKYFEVSVTKFISKDSKFTPDFAKEDITEVIEKGISFVEEVKGATTSTKGVLAETGLAVEKPALLGKLATVHLANTICSTLKINDSLNLPILSSRELPFCFSGTGTGFYVNSSGTIVTNAHVASGNLFSSTEELFLSDEGAVFGAIRAELYASYLSSGDTSLSEVTVEEFNTLVRVYILQLIGQKKITFANTTYENYLEVGEPFEFDSYTGKIKDPSKYKKLTVLSSNQLTSRLEHLGKLVVEKKSIESNPYTLDVADLAVLKIDAADGNYPSIPLGNPDTLVEGATLFTIGFPGIADNRTLFSDASSMSATIAKGTISAIKNNSSNEYKLIQTDASINRGNSGGPMINQSGEVVGVSTYLMSSDGGNYGAGVSVEEVKNILSTASVTTSESDITRALLSGLDNMQKEYYQWAIRDFDLAMSKYPLGKNLIQPLKLLAQEKIEKGEDNTPIYTLGSIAIHKGDLPYIIGGLVLALVAFIILLVLLLKKGKPMQPMVTPTMQAVMPEPQLPQPVLPATPVAEVVSQPQIQQPVPVAPVFSPEPPAVVNEPVVASAVNMPVAAEAMPQTQDVPVVTVAAPQVQDVSGVEETRPQIQEAPEVAVSVPQFQPQVATQPYTPEPQLDTVQTSQPSAEPRVPTMVPPTGQVG
ncbi:MAG: trypsin-like peptidase domain-containing protein [Patescibacteria group bacterium]